MEDFMNMLTPYDIADLMQVSYDTALEFIKTSGIPFVRVGRQYRVSEKAFNAFVSAGQQKTVQPGSKNIYYNGNSHNTMTLRRR